MRASTRAALAGFLAVPALAAAVPVDQGAWLVRARYLHLDPGLTDTIGLFVTVEPLRFTELDLSWFARPWLAIELGVTWPQTHLVKSAGFEVGRLRQLPPTLVLQAHLPGYRLRPYLGVGASYTLISGLRFAPEFSQTLQPTLRNHSFGLVLAAGVDVPIDGRWSLNLDVKRLNLKTDLSRFGPDIGEFKVRPLLWSAGVGWRF